MKWFFGATTFVGSVTSIVAFFGIKWSDLMQSIESFLDHLDFWSSAFIVSLFITIISFCVWRFLVNKDKNKSVRSSTKAVLSPNESVDIIKDGDKWYLVRGDTCQHIPNPETFNYLGALFGFSWGDAKFMSLDEIERNFKIRGHLPGIQSFCKSQDLKK